MTDERATYSLPWAFHEIRRLDRDKASRESVTNLEADIREIRDDQKWTRRAVTSVFLMLVANLVVLWVNLGIA